MMKLSWHAPLTSEPMQLSHADATRLLEATTCLPALLMVRKLPMDQHVHQVRNKRLKPFSVLL